MEPGLAEIDMPKWFFVKTGEDLAPVIETRAGQDCN